MTGDTINIVLYLYYFSRQVLLGGGRHKFLPKNVTDPEYPNKTGERADGRNLIQVDFVLFKN